jgi:hypothetical protein
MIRGQLSLKLRPAPANLKNTYLLTTVFAADFKTDKPPEMVPIQLFCD